MATDLQSMLNPDAQRVSALNSVLRNTADGDIEKAISSFGSSLSDADKNMLRSLKKEELTALASGVGKLGGLMTTAKLDNNVNI